jgi:hypothetical protein
VGALGTEGAGRADTDLGKRRHNHVFSMSAGRWLFRVSTLPSGLLSQSPQVPCTPKPSLSPPFIKGETESQD